MVTKAESTCPKCGGELKHYDTVKRIIRTKGRRTEWIRIARVRCTRCGTFHRSLPEDLLPFKQYEAEVIFGVLEELITCETVGFEDYPCEITMERWKTQKSQLLLWR